MNPVLLNRSTSRAGGFLQSSSFGDDHPNRQVARYNPNSDTQGTDQVGMAYNDISGYQERPATGADPYYKLGARYYDAHGHFTQPDSIQGVLTPGVVDLSRIAPRCPVQGDNLIRTE